MPILQSTIKSKMAIGAIGRRANMEEWNTITRISENATIGFAVPVQRGANLANGIVPFTTGKFLGITEQDETAFGNYVDSMPSMLYPRGYNVPVCDMGVINALAIGTCTAGNPAYYGSGGWTDTAGGNTKVPSVEFETSAAAAGIVQLRIRRTPGVA
jgi:hypothetical protein